MNSQLDLAMATAAQSAAEALCLACSGRNITPFFELPEVPTTTLKFCSTREAALACPTGSIEFGFCGDCGAVSNLRFDPGRVLYDSAYDNSLHFSPAFQRYAEEVARHLFLTYNLRGKNIIDVGCGSAEFLAMLCEVGDNLGIGFDPSFIPGRADLQSGRGVTIVRDYFYGLHPEYPADFLLCRHVLEHISNPQSFLGDVRAVLAGRSPATVFFEVPNSLLTFQNIGIWDIIYEHCLYYCPGSLVHLFAGCGFDVLRVYEAFDRQYVCLEARGSSAAPGAPPLPLTELALMRQAIARFAHQYRCYRNHWEHMLNKLAAEQKRVAVWGAGAKGSMFLNTFRYSPSPAYVVDINPHKWSLYIPLAGQQIMPPTFLREFRPDVVLIANSMYHQEVSNQLSELGLSPQLITI